MTVPEKHLHTVSADVERAGLNGDRRTGRVALRGLPSWLKQQTFITTSMSPQKARRLAIQLLMAAEKAEEKW